MATHARDSRKPARSRRSAAERPSAAGLLDSFFHAAHRAGRAAAAAQRPPGDGRTRHRARGLVSANCWKGCARRRQPARSSPKRMPGPGCAADAGELDVVLAVEVAVAKVAKYAVRESGDSVEVVERPNGGLSVVMVDGQRSGRSAKAISNVAVRKAISLLAEGVRDGAVARATHDYLRTQRGGPGVRRAYDHLGRPRDAHRGDLPQHASARCWSGRCRRRARSTGLDCARRAGPHRGRRQAGQAGDRRAAADAGPGIRGVHRRGAARRIAAGRAIGRRRRSRGPLRHRTRPSAQFLADCVLNAAVSSRRKPARATTPPSSSFASSTASPKTRSKSGACRCRFRFRQCSHHQDTKNRSYTKALV